jgi:hypothetical protein
MKGPQNEWIPATVAEITEKQKELPRVLIGPQGEAIVTRVPRKVEPKPVEYSDEEGPQGERLPKD